MTPRDPEAIIAGAALPAPLGRIVLETVRRTRLWKSERADVADELVGHFRDGLDRGAAPEDLAAAFGLPTTAAPLIRRAKKRSRPLAWRLARGTLRTAAAGTALLLSLYAIMVLRFFTGAPTISRDYLAELTQAARAVPRAERAWPVYRSARMAIGPIPDDLDLATQPGQAGWDGVSGFVAARAEALATAREAAARPGLGYVAGHGIDEADRALWPDQPVSMAVSPAERGLMFVLLPQLAELRTLGLLLAVESLAAAERGDGALAAADVEAMLGIANHTAETPVLISDLRAMAAITHAARTLGTILERRPGLLDDARLRALADRFAMVRGGGRLSVRFDSECLFFQDVLQRLYTDDGQGDGRVSAAGLRAVEGLDLYGGSVGPLAPAACAILAGRREMAAEFDRLLAVAEAERAKPLWEQDRTRMDDEVERLMSSRLLRARYLPVALLMPAMGKAIAQGDLATTERDAVLVAIALERFRRRAGAYPAALDALVPDMLPAVPMDCFDGRPLRYRIDEEGEPLLYSVGADRDDDAGVGPAQRPGGRWRKRPTWAGAEGDWVLWPAPPE